MKFEDMKKIGGMFKNMGQMKALSENYAKIQEEYQHKKFYGQGGAGDLTAQAEFSLAGGFSGFVFSDNLMMQPSHVVSEIITQAANSAFMNAQMALKQAMGPLQEALA